MPELNVAVLAFFSPTPSFGFFQEIIWAALGCRLYYGTEYLGVPNWNPNFGNHPFPSMSKYIGLYFCLLWLPHPPASQSQLPNLNHYWFNEGLDFWGLGLRV